MKYSDAQEIIDSLSKDRTLFYYFKDYYACLLLMDLADTARSVRGIKQSPYSRLLNRPLVKDILKTAGSGFLDDGTLMNCWPTDVHCYRLTLGVWGPEDRSRWSRGYHQMARRGVNLVLHLNFNNQTNKPYIALSKHEQHSPFSFRWHPNAREGFNTLAWARMDVDFESGEVLIEEVQNDWLRVAKRRADNWRLSSRNGKNHPSAEELAYRTDLENYMTEIVAVQEPIWSEAMLAATIYFIRHELGMNEIYYYDFETGCRLKDLSGRSRPPKSLYTTLPRKFCFERVQFLPKILNSGLSRTTLNYFRDVPPYFWKLPTIEQSQGKRA